MENNLNSNIVPGTQNNTIGTEQKQSTSSDKVPNEKPSNTLTRDSGSVADLKDIKLDVAGDKAGDTAQNLQNAREISYKDKNGADIKFQVGDVVDSDGKRKNVALTDEKTFEKIFDSQQKLREGTQEAAKQENVEDILKELKKTGREVNYKPHNNYHPHNKDNKNIDPFTAMASTTAKGIQAVAGGAADGLKKMADATIDTFGTITGMNAPIKMAEQMADSSEDAKRMFAAMASTTANGIKKVADVSAKGIKKVGTETLKTLKLIVGAYAKVFKFMFLPSSMINKSVSNKAENSEKAGKQDQSATKDQQQSFAATKTPQQNVTTKATQQQTAATESRPASQPQPPAAKESKSATQSHQPPAESFRERLDNDRKQANNLGTQAIS